MRTPFSAGDALPVVLAVNAGSSSLKFGAYAADGGQAVFSGSYEGLEPGGSPTFRPAGAEAQPLPEGPDGGSGDAFARALAHLGQWLAQPALSMSLQAVSHRVVHGGDFHDRAVVADDAVLAQLATLAPLAPLHQPQNLAGVRAFRRAFPAVPQVLCFDTAFHATMPPLERRFALPDIEALKGVRRYGFHGLSYDHVMGVLRRHSALASGRVLMAHLGNGASLCAALEGRSVATTMGFSALEGLMMGTRSGSLDAGVLLHLMRQGWDAGRIEKLLYKESGLRGVSGTSADMRTLQASGDPRAAEAIALFTYRIVRESGALAAVLGGLDVLVFTGGIGEHQASVRAGVCAALAHLGVRLDERSNAQASGAGPQCVSAEDSGVEVWVVPTDEGRVAASNAWALLGVTQAPTVRT